MPIQHQPAKTGDDQPLVDEEILHVIARDHPDQHEHDERQRADDIGRCLRFRRHRLDLQLHLRALAQHRCEVPKCFGEVAAGFPLDRDGDDEELELGRAEPVGGVLKRGVHRPADLHAVGDQAEFLAHRPGNLGTNQAHRLRNRQARTQSADQQFDRVRKFVRELIDAALDEEIDDEMGDPRTRKHRDQQGEDDWQALQPQQCRDDDGDAARRLAVFADCPVLAGHVQALLQHRRIGQQAGDEGIGFGQGARRDAAHPFLGRGTDLDMAFAHGAEPARAGTTDRRPGKGDRDHADEQHRPAGHE